MEAHGGSGYPESPFIKVFGTNFAPSPKEITQIRELLHEPEKRLGVLEAEIARLHSQREELKSFINKHRSLLSPIRRIPADTLREIFMRCLPEDHLPTNNIRKAPLLLTSICRSWREVAISTPRLWNRIHISLPYPLSSFNDFFRSWMQISSEGLKLWLERSGKVPLTLSLITDDESGGRHTDSDAAELQKLYADFARLLLPYASRWKCLSLDVTPTVASFLGELSVGQLTLLEEFKLDLGDTPMSGGGALHILFRHSPSLHVLHLNGVPLDLPIRWGNLTEVGIDSHELLPSQTIRVLSLSSTSLRRCVLHLQFPYRFVPVMFSWDTPVVFPYLHTLDIHFRHSCPISAVASELEHFFGALVAPMLKALSLREKYRLFDEAFDRLPFLNLLQRSACSLSSLNLNLKVPATAVVMCLQQVPSLTELQIHGGVSTGPREVESPFPLSDFLHALTPSLMETSAAVCPNLEIFTCTECSPSHAASLLAFAEARSVSVPSGDSKSLKRMRVAFKQFIEDTDTPFRLKSLREKGMWILWSSPPDRRRSLGRPWRNRFLENLS